MIGYLGTCFGMAIFEADEGEMRELVARAGGDPETWQEFVVFLWPPGLEREARASSAACARLRAEIPKAIP